MIGQKMTDAYQAALSFQIGEENGFKFFFNELHSSLNYFAYRIVNDKDVAEDVVEESFIKIWERRQTFDHPKVIKSWLYTTVKNACLNHLQNKNYKEKKLQAHSSFLSEEDDSNAEIELIKNEEAHNLRMYIEDLPTACRQVFRMMLNGMKAREIATELDLAISTVKNQYARGKKILYNWITSGVPSLSSMSVSSSGRIEEPLEEEVFENELQDEPENKPIPVSKFVLPEGLSLKGLQDGHRVAWVWYCDQMNTRLFRWVNWMVDERDEIDPKDVIGEVIADAWENRMSWESLDHCMGWSWVRAKYIISAHYIKYKRRLKVYPILHWMFEETLTDSQALEIDKEKAVQDTIDRNNIDQIKKILPDLPKTCKQVTLLYLENDRDKLNRAKKQGTVNEDTIGNFNRKSKYSFSEIRNRLSFFDSCKVDDNILLKLKESLIQLPRKQRMMIFRLIHGDSIEKIAKERGTEIISLTNVIKCILIKIKNIYPHPILMDYKESVENKVKRFMSSSDPEVKKVLNMLIKEGVALEKFLYKDNRKYNAVEIYEKSKGLTPLEASKILGVSSQYIGKLQANFEKWKAKGKYKNYNL